MLIIYNLNICITIICLTSLSCAVAFIDEWTLSFLKVEPFYDLNEKNVFDDLLRKSSMIIKAVKC